MPKIEDWMGLGGIVRFRRVTEHAGAVGHIAGLILEGNRVILFVRLDDIGRTVQCDSMAVEPHELDAVELASMIEGAAL